MDYLKRLFGAAFGFSLLGGGGLALCLTLFPLVRLFSNNQAQSQRRIRLIVIHSFRLYLTVLEFIGLFKLETAGLEKLKSLKGTLVVCNHPSLLDVVIIISRFGSIQCVVKGKLWKNPLLGGVVLAAGYIRNDTNPKIFLDRCQKYLESGENILIFPEGTRSKPGHPLKLQRGVGNIALAVKADIHALLMKCTPPYLTKGEKWYEVPSEKPVFSLESGRFFPIEPYQTDAPRSLRVRALMTSLQAYYNEQLGYE